MKRLRLASPVTLSWNPSWRRRSSASLRGVTSVGIRRCGRPRRRRPNSDAAGFDPAETVVPVANAVFDFKRIFPRSPKRVNARLTNSTSSGWMRSHSTCSCDFQFLRRYTPEGFSIGVKSMRLEGRFQSHRPSLAARAARAYRSFVALSASSAAFRVVMSRTRTRVWSLSVGRRRAS